MQDFFKVNNKLIILHHFQINPIICFLFNYFVFHFTGIYFEKRWDQDIDDFHKEMNIKLLTKS